MKKLEYKGYIINATSHQLAKDKHWSVHLQIERHIGSCVNVGNYRAANTFPTEEEAIQHCFNFGKQIIDGKAEGCSVGDL